MPHFGLILAAIALTLHGLIEIAPMFFQRRMAQAGNQPGKGMPQFIFKPLQDNLKVTIALGEIFGVLRILAAVAILLNLMWGWWLGVILSVVTYIIMTLYLPMGIFDGILSGIALVSLLITYFGSQPIR